MTCPNCGLANPDTAKFCANCGTAFSAASRPPGSTTTRNIAIGCLILVLIFLFVSLSCTRSCWRWTNRTYIHRRR